jgi:hypothetical protein
VKKEHGTLLLAGTCLGKSQSSKNATQAQDMCSKQLLRSISGVNKVFGKVKEKE